jgi:hypothetical protein
MSECHLSFHCRQTLHTEQPLTRVFPLLLTFDLICSSRILLLAQVVLCLVLYPEVSDSGLSRHASYPDLSFFMVFLSPPGICLKLGHESFLRFIPQIKAVP